MIKNLKIFNVFQFRAPPNKTYPWPEQGQSWSQWEPHWDNQLHLSNWDKLSYYAGKLKSNEYTFSFSVLCWYRVSSSEHQRHHLFLLCLCLFQLVCAFSAFAKVKAVNFLCMVYDRSVALKVKTKVSSQLLFVNHAGLVLKQTSNQKCIQYQPIRAVLI